MRFIKFLFSACMLFIFNTVHAQNTTIKGYVYDLQSNQPIEGAIIHAEASTTISETDKNGHFSIETTKDNGRLHISYSGYISKIINHKSDKDILNIRLERDVHSLEEVKVEAFSKDKTIKESAGSIALLSGALLKQSSQVSMQDALNSVPGVRMDQSSLNDSRISIRGIGLRAPWGLRNIKVYINDIPLTEADGTTRIEALDIPDLGQAEVIKGPASSIYGGGTGGVLKFQLDRSPYQEQSLEASAMVGSYGLSRYALTYRGGTDKMNSFVSYGRQHYNGYREHNTDSRNFLTANFQFFPSEKRTITALVSRSHQDAQIAGALTADQVAQNPRQAASSELLQQAGRIQTWTRVGLGQQYRFNDRFSNSTSLFTYFYDLDHPLPFGIVRNFYQSAGGRTKFDYDPHFEKLPTIITVGGELNQALSKGTVYVNNKGTEGPIMTNTDYKNTLYSLFAQASTKIADVLDVELGLSFNGITYDVKNYLNPGNDGVINFHPQVSPRLALSHHFGKWMSLHGSISSGYAPPSTDQISNPDKTLNKSIGAERGINYELNFKGALLNSRLNYDLAFYKMNMKGELIAQTISPSVTVYHNSGKTVHNGAELSLSWQAIKESDHKAISVLRPYAAVTYSDFRYLDYKVLNPNGEILADYVGNKLSGVTPWVVNMGINLESKSGIYANVNYYFSDKIALNDANTDFNKAYSVLNAKLGYKKEIGKHLILDVYTGLNNILNEKYSSYLALNAAGWGGASPAYFNPSPAINGYLGANFRYFFNK